eukprot:11997055-Heterocapsa_arctica.AAC.1
MGLRFPVRLDGKRQPSIKQGRRRVAHERQRGIQHDDRRRHSGPAQRGAQRQLRPRRLSSGIAGQ